MAVLQTGGTYVYSQTATNLINAAYRAALVIGEEETCTGYQLEQGMDLLNAMAKGWQATGIHLWCEEECILFPQANQREYLLGPGTPDHACLFDQLTQGALALDANTGATSLTLVSAAGMNSGDFFGVQLDSGVNFWTSVSGQPVGNVVTIVDALPNQATAAAIVFDYPTPLMRPLRVPAARRYVYSSQIQTSMLMLSRLGYHNLSNPFTTGTITQAFFDPQTGQGSYQSAVAQVFLWPSPTDFNSGFNFTAQRPIQDFVSLSNIPDFPVEWNAALKWNLALEVAPIEGTPTEQFSIIEKMAARWYSVASQWDREPESIRFGVAMSPGYSIPGGP